MDYDQVQTMAQKINLLIIRSMQNLTSHSEYTGNLSGNVRLLSI